MMARIFISYRRADSQWATSQLHKALCQHFGEQQVFMDIRTIAPGEDFVQVIEDEVGSCDALIAMIGTEWLTITDDAGRRRLDNPHDYVRLEIATALKRGIYVVPVLIDGTSMPHASDLPDDLAALARRNAAELTARSFDHDVQQLTASLGEVLGVPPVPAAQVDAYLSKVLPRLELEGFQCSEDVEVAGCQFKYAVEGQLLLRPLGNVDTFFLFGVFETIALDELQQLSAECFDTVRMYSKGSWFIAVITVAITGSIDAATAQAIPKAKLREVGDRGWEYPAIYDVQTGKLYYSKVMPLQGAGMQFMALRNKLENILAP